MSRLIREYYPAPLVKDVLNHGLFRIVLNPHTIVVPQRPRQVFVEVMNPSCKGRATVDDLLTAQRFSPTSEKATLFVLFIIKNSLMAAGPNRPERLGEVARLIFEFWGITLQDDEEVLRRWFELEREGVPA